MSTISASTTLTTAFGVTGDTTGTLVLQTGATPTTAVTISASQVVTFAKPPTATGGGSVSTNTAYGTSALAANTTGAYSTAVGALSLQTNTSGTQNQAFGYAALNLNTTGSYNTAVGTSALTQNTTANYGTAVGYQAGYSNTTSSGNTFVGYQSGYTNITSDFLDAHGYVTLYSNTSGVGNSAFGRASMYANTTGSENAAYGNGYNVYAALRFNTTGSYNAAFGAGALANNTTGVRNTAVGCQAGYGQTTNTRNVFVGFYTGATASGDYNVCMGAYTGSRSSFTGSTNTLIGDNADSQTLTSGTGNVMIGAQNLPSSATVSNEIVIGTGGARTGKGTNTGFISPYGGGVYQGNNSSTWSVTSDERLKKNIVENNQGLEKILQVPVFNFDYRKPDEITELAPTDAIEKEGTQLGTVAQRLLEAGLSECIKTESTGVMTVDTDPLIWYLINSIKQLKAEIEELKGQK